MLDPVVKHEWCAALRSGKYKQGYIEMKQTDDDGTFYCCLGVVAAIIPGLNWGFRFNEESLKRLGLSEEAQRHLILMNDRDGATFDVIATYIEREL
jgi:hypothetical protein